MAVKNKTFTCKHPEGDHTMFYRDWGDPDNPNVLFCVHGITRNSRDYDYLAQALQKDYRVICPDIVGRGNSDRLEDKSRYFYPTYIKDCLQLLDHLGADIVDWVGTSMGGLTAMGLAQEHPDRIRRLVLNDVGPSQPVSILSSLLEYLGKEEIFPNYDMAELYMRRTYTGLGMISNDQWRDLTNHSITERDDGTYTLAYDTGISVPLENLMTIPDLKLENWPMWEALQCKVLVIHGEHSEILLPDTVERMCSTGPKAQVIEYANTGHAPALMNEGLVGRIHQWLND